MKIFCIDTNYASCNTQENAADEDPVVFLKPDSALLGGGRPFFVPDHLGPIDGAAELVVRICRLGKSVPVRFASRYYDAVTVGIDFTARTLQRRLAEKGRPWDLAKGFDGAAYIGEWVDKTLLPDIGGLHFCFRTDGTVVGEGFTASMLRSVDELVAYLSRFYTLKTGDLLFTGTPLGAITVKAGDRLEGLLEGRCVLDCPCR